MDPKFLCEVAGCPLQFYEDCDICEECYCENHLHDCASREDDQNWQPLLSDSSTSQAVSCPSQSSLCETESFLTPASNTSNSSRIQQGRAQEERISSSSQQSSSSSSQQTRSSSSSSQIAISSVFKKQIVGTKRRRPTSSEPIAVTPFRHKWGPGEEARNPNTVKLESFKGTCWIWKYFKRLSKEDCGENKPNYEASCITCLSEAKEDNRIRFMVYFDGSTTKLVRHMRACHEELVKEHTDEIAGSLVSEGDSKTMAEFLRTGTEDDTLYNYLKMCVMNFLPISLCSYKEFNGKDSLVNVNCIRNFSCFVFCIFHYLSHVFFLCLSNVSNFQKSVDVMIKSYCLQE